MIPFGGSSVLGAQGYVDGGLELLEQAPDLDTIVVAVGSGGTMSGLVHVLGADRVLSVSVRRSLRPCRNRDRTRQPGLSAHGSVPKLRTRPEVGNGYSELSAGVECHCPCRANRGHHRILLHRRALAGLVASVRGNDIRPGRRTVLLTRGGLPGLFGHRQAMIWARSSWWSDALVWSLRSSAGAIPDGADLRQQYCVGKVPRLTYSGLRTASGPFMSQSAAPATTTP